MTPLFLVLLLPPTLAATPPGEAAPLQWTHLSSRSGDLPAPGASTQQTACLVVDLDRDGLNDIVVASRGTDAAIVWYRRTTGGWTVYPIDRGLNLEAGGASADIDGDGDLDLVFGEDFSGSRLFWWENPRPKFDRNTPWVRRVIKNRESRMHHDQLFGDFDGDGKDELLFWVQRFDGLLIARIPDDPRAGLPWPSTPILPIRRGEGLARADIDGDGKLDAIGGGYWFKHRGGAEFEPRLIDRDSFSSRAAAGQLVEGGAPETVFVNGDGIGRLRWFEYRHDAWTGHDLLGFDVIHGHSLELADIDQDGHLDIFCAEMAKWTDTADVPDHPGARMWIFHGDGRGRFRTTVMATGVDNHESRVADLDGDGDLDIVSKPYNHGTPRLDVWLNRGTGPRRRDASATGTVRGR